MENELDAIRRLFFHGSGQKVDLFCWKRLVPKRKWRRWRGRVKAGKAIPSFYIDFDPPGRGLPLPFISPLGDTSHYRKD